MAKTIKLEKNYRSVSTILEAANNVIENNYIKNNSVCFVYSKNKKVLFSNTKKNIINSIQHKLYKNAIVKNVKTNSNGLQWFIEISI